jgi:hypothetical protein
MQPHMVRSFPVLNSNGGITRLRISLPRIDALIEPGGYYALEEATPPKVGRELRAHRAP